MLQLHSHRRQNLLTGEWVLVSPQRTQRPWEGQLEDVEAAGETAYEPDCYLCPGNKRAAGNHNPDYTGPYAFDNDFPALSARPGKPTGNHPLFISRPEAGCCRVVCFSERHDLRLSEMEPIEAEQAIAFLFDQFSELDRREELGYVQIFENRGRMMGCSNAHPHAQIWATSGVPVEPGKEWIAQKAYFEAHGQPLLLDYLQAELKAHTRLVFENRQAVSLVPFWAFWPFETLILPREPLSGPDKFSREQIAGFAQVLQSTLKACDRLFGIAMPYSMGFHPRPSDGGDHPEWQFHAHIYPPLLRSANIRKYMVGFEMLGMPQRDITPEAAAQRLRTALDALG